MDHSQKLSASQELSRFEVAEMAQSVVTLRSPAKICSQTLFERGTTEVATDRAQQALRDHGSWLKTTLGALESSEDVVVAYLCANSLDFLLSALSCSGSDIEALPALLNTRWTVSEISVALQSVDSKAQTLLVYSEEFESSTVEIQKRLGDNCLTRPLPRMSESVSCQQAPEMDHQPIAELSSSDAMIFFTSGSTSGKPKGVRLSHKALITQMSAKLKFYDSSTRMWASDIPLFHIGGWTNLCAVLMAGGILVWSSQLSLIERFPFINSMVMVPAMVYNLKKRYHVTPSKHIRMIMVGGQSLLPEHIDYLKTTFPCATVMQTYAFTEAASSVTFHQVLPQKELGDPLLDCIGRPPMHIELGILDTDQLTRFGRQEWLSNSNTIGVLATRGPHTLNGFWSRGLTASNHTGWYISGDLVSRDDCGLWYFRGRLRDAIRTGGETVMALEIEAVLRKHSSVHDCAVFALPDPKFGQIVSCALVSSNPSTSLHDVRNWCAEQGLASYKKPRQLHLLSDLPRNSSGKVLKYKLVQRFSRCMHKSNL